MLTDKNLFLENGYINMRAIIEHTAFTKIIIGGRGTGKTWGVLDYVSKKESYKCFMMRRTREVVKTLTTEELSPFKKYERKSGKVFNIDKLTDGITRFSLDGEKDYKFLLSAITIFNNMRGFDGDEISMLFYDEFIRIKNERKIKGEADGFFNAIETINRNRELEGNSPLNVILSGNSDLLDSDILVELGLVNSIIKMRKKEKNIKYFKERGILLIVLKDSPISERKKDTALYKMTAGTKFNSMAISNKFVSNELHTCKHYNLNQLIPLFYVNDQICVYSVKNTDRFWCSAHKSGVPEIYEDCTISYLSIKKRYRKILYAYIDGLVEFEEEYLELIFRNIFTFKL